jgi:hypothetical protein
MQRHGVDAKGNVHEMVTLIQVVCAVISVINFVDYDCRHTGTCRPDDLLITSVCVWRRR